jgi:hypothetical protein
MKDMKWKASCEKCQWETNLMTEGEAHSAALEHDREKHGRERVAVRISEDGQVVA